MIMYTTQDIIKIVVVLVGIPAIITAKLVYIIICKIKSVKILKIKHALIKYILSIVAFIIFLWFIAYSGVSFAFIIYGMIVGSLFAVGNEQVK